MQGRIANTMKMLQQKHLYAMYNSDTFSMTACGHNTKGESLMNPMSQVFRHP